MDIKSNLLTLPENNNTLQPQQNYTNIQGLEELKKKAREDQRSALKPVAKQFEAIFVQQVFKEARKVSFDDGWLDGNQGAFYKDWHDKQLAQDLAAKGTLGFADKIVEDLLPSIPAVKNAKSSEAVTKTNTQVDTQTNTLGKIVDRDNIAASTEAVLKLRNIK